MLLDSVGIFTTTTTQVTPHTEFQEASHLATSWEKFVMLIDREYPTNLESKISVPMHPHAIKFHFRSLQVRYVLKFIISPLWN
jgi:hypothetical protein